MNRTGLPTIVLALFLLPVALGALPQAEESVVYRESLDGVRTVRVTTGSVDVDVMPTDGEAAIVAELLERREFDVSVRGEEAVVEIGGIGMSVGIGVRERVRLMIPDGASVVISTGSGDITVTDLNLAELRVSGGSSDVDVRRVSGRLALSLASGDVELTTFDGELAIQTSSGDVRGEEVRLTADAEITTSSGDVTMELDHADSDLSFFLTASSGDLRVNRTRGEDRLRTGDGDIEVRGRSSSGDQTYRTE